MRSSALGSSQRRLARSPGSILVLSLALAGSFAVADDRSSSTPPESATATVSQAPESATVSQRASRTSGWGNGRPTAPGQARKPRPTTTTSTTTSTTSTTTSTSPTTIPVITVPPELTTTTTSTTTAPSTTSTTTAPSTTAPPTTGTPITGASLVGVGERRYGFAEWRGITGGLGAASYVVTSAADSGAGTYRDALSKGNRYVTFAAELDGSVIRLNGDVTSGASNITIDAAGRDITVSRFATKFSGTNIVIAGMQYRGMDGSANEDAITFRDASAEQVFALYGNTFETATDGLVDVIWNRGHDVYGTICGNQFLRHDKAMLIHSGDTANEGGRYHVTICENQWVDVIQRAPFTRDSRIHQYNDVFDRYGDHTGAGGGSKSGADGELSQHLLQNNIAIPRRVGEVTWTGAVVTRPRTEFAGPQWGSGGAIRIDGSLLLSSSDTTATQLENLRSQVSSPPYQAGVMPADMVTKSAVEQHAGSCAPTPAHTANPCAPIVTAAGGVIAFEVAGDATKVVVRLDGANSVEAHHVGGGRWEATLPVGQVGWVDAVVTDHQGATLHTNRAVVVAR